MRLRSALVVAFALTANARHGRAEVAAPEARESARVEFARGVEHVREGDFELAVAAFEAAYRARPHFLVLYNLAQAHAALGRSVEAVSSFRRYLAEGGDQVDAQRRLRVLELIARHERRIGFLELRVEPSDAEVLVNGRVLESGAASSPIALVSGQHGLIVRAPGAIPFAETFEIRAGQTVQVSATLTAAAVAPSRSASEAVAPSPPRAPSAVPWQPLSVEAARLSVELSEREGAERRARNAALGLGAGGVVLAGVAIGVWSWNGGRHDEWSIARRRVNADLSSGDVDDDALREDAALEREAVSIQRADDIALGLLVVGVAACTASAIVWFTRDAGDETAPKPGGRAGVDWRRGLLRF